MATSNFLGELKRRNVYKVAVAYAVVSWVIAQVATQIFPFLEIPNWVIRLIILLLALGFPIALIIAWAFEATPEGIRRTEVADAMPGSGTRKKHAWIYVVIIGAAISATLFFLGRYTAGRNASAAHGETAAVSAKSIAVLPFENLSDDKNAAYFADGIQDEILTKLASVAHLKVISRTSTAKYKSKPEDLKTVAQQLGVVSVLEGSVQKAADKVRVNVQLIDAQADSHLWAKTYDRDLKDVFAIQSEVAQEIADALQAKLSPAEARTLAAAPTQNTTAYDFYLRGEYEEAVGIAALKAESLDQAANWYRQAIATDPGFALAMARLVENRMYRHWFIEQMSEAELAEVKDMAEKALTFAPGLAEAHVALGQFYYHGYRDYERALAEFARAIELQPNNSQALRFAGFVHRRQGQWLRCLEELKKALEQDPRDASLSGNLAATYLPMRLWNDGANAARHALSIDPRAVEGMRTLLRSILDGSGDINEAQRVLATFPADNQILVSSNFGDVREIIGERAYIFVVARNFEGALKLWEHRENVGTDERRRLSARVAIQVLAGDLTRAETEGQEAAHLLEERLRQRPNDVSCMTELSWCYLALNRKSEAIQTAREAARLLPPEKDAVVGPFVLTGLAQIETRAGGAGDAIAILRRQLSEFAGHVSIARLRIDPVWDPIRNDPGFKQLLAGKELIGADK